MLERSTLTLRSGPAWARCRLLWAATLIFAACSSSKPATSAAVDASPSDAGSSQPSAAPSDAAASDAAPALDAGVAPDARGPEPHELGNWDRTCQPSPNGPVDRCIVCLAEQCCDKLAEQFCGEAPPYVGPDGGVLTTGYVCAGTYLNCVLSCFARGASTNPSTGSAQLLAECGEQCAKLGTFNDVRRRLFDCLTGGALTDNDGGANDPNCLPSCLPDWR